jgi:hypothetical protein
LNANVTNAKPPVKYRWISSQPSASNDSASSYSVYPTTAMNVELRVTDSTGCMMSSKIYITPSGVFNLGADIKRCTGDTALFSGPAGMTSYLWLPDSSTGRSFKTVKAGKYILRTLDSLNCPFSDTVRFDTLALPKKKFFGMDTTICVGDSIRIYADSGYASYTWSTGSKSRGIVLGSAGMVHLLLIDSNGCMNRDTLVAYMDSVPAFYFSTSATAAKSFIFIPSLYNPLYFYSWDFGDGDTSHIISASHAYSNPGTYTVCLTIRNTNGCVDSVCQSVAAFGVKQIAAGLPVLVYPNPFGNYIELSLDLPAKADISTRLYNMLGAEIYSWPEEAAGAGEYKKILDVSNLNLQNGVYTLKLTVNSQDVYIRLLKAN